MHLKRIIHGSRIIRSISEFNANYLNVFLNSATRAFFANMNRFYRDRILQYAAGSIIINMTRRAVHKVTLCDLGIFVILVVLFNTLFMLFMQEAIGPLSIYARVLFLLVGLFLIVKK